MSNYYNKCRTNKILTNFKIVKHLLYIGLKGYAGSGKDTVAKMLRTILSMDWESKEQCYEYYQRVYNDPTRSATFNDEANKNSKAMCVAYADQLKTICAEIFGIPVERFYKNKETAWVCINDKFQYTEHKPAEDEIVTAEEFYYSDYGDDDECDFSKNEKEKCWMSLRELLVYVGTYVLQYNVNRSIFVNIVRNMVKRECEENIRLKYVIITDTRFYHELKYLNEKNGISIVITRDDIKELDNIAEHELDDEMLYDFTIDNSGTLDELFTKVWNLVATEPVFSNITVELEQRENVGNYLRLLQRDDNTATYLLCISNGISQITHRDGKWEEIAVLTPVGGPTFTIGRTLNGITENETIKSIEMSEYDNRIYITTTF